MVRSAGFHTEGACTQNFKNYNYLWYLFPICRYKCKDALILNTMSQVIAFHSAFPSDSAAAIPDSESEDTLSASEGEGQGEESVRLRSGTPGFDSQRGVVTIQGSGEVRMKKADLLIGPLPKSLGELLFNLQYVTKNSIVKPLLLRMFTCRRFVKDSCTRNYSQAS